MRKILFTLSATLLASASALAQTDTLAVGHKEEVKVIRSGLGWDFSLIEKKRRKTYLGINIRAQATAGWNFILDKPSDMNMKWVSTYELGLEPLHFVFEPANKWKLTLSMGYLFNRYTFRDCMMTTPSEGTTKIVPVPDGCSIQTSSIYTHSGIFTLMAKYQPAKNHSIGLGISWIGRTMDECYYKSKLNMPDGTTVTDMNEMPIQRNLLGIKAEYMYIDRIGFYLRYIPTRVFRKDHAPNFQQLCVGLQVRL